MRKEFKLTKRSVRKQITGSKDVEWLEQMKTFLDVDLARAISPTLDAERKEKQDKYFRSLQALIEKRIHRLDLEIKPWNRVKNFFWFIGMVFSDKFQWVLVRESWADMHTRNYMAESKKIKELMNKLNNKTT